jgi:hypothetical protein
LCSDRGLLPAFVSRLEWKKYGIGRGRAENASCGELGAGHSSFHATINASWGVSSPSFDVVRPAMCSCFNLISFCKFVLKVSTCAYF